MLNHTKSTIRALPTLGRQFLVKAFPFITMLQILRYILQIEELDLRQADQIYYSSKALKLLITISVKNVT